MVSLRLFRMSLQPRTDFSLPFSDGYLLYSALLSEIGEMEEKTGETLHESSEAVVNISGLEGEFESAEGEYRKTAVSKNTYDVSIGVCVSEPQSENAFDALARSLVLGDVCLDVGDGQMEVRSFQSQSVDSSKLLVSDTSPDTVSQFSFDTPTCLQAEEGDATTMYPTARPVFKSLEAKWNRVVGPEEMLTVDARQLDGAVFESPLDNSLRTYSVVVGNSYDEDAGHERPIKEHAFTAQCRYGFTESASESLRNAVATLTRFAEYSGVGTATSRGCGTVSTSLLG